MLQLASGCIERIAPQRVVAGRRPGEASSHGGSSGVGCVMRELLLSTGRHPF